jgi:hypothetical protein
MGTFTRQKAKRQFVVHGDYSVVPTVAQKSLRYFEGYLELLAVFQKFYASFFHDF